MLLWICQITFIGALFTHALWVSHSGSEKMSFYSCRNRQGFCPHIWPLNTWVKTLYVSIRPYCTVLCGSCPPSCFCSWWLVSRADCSPHQLVSWWAKAMHRGREKSGPARRRGAEGSAPAIRNWKQKIRFLAKIFQYFGLWRRFKYSSCWKQVLPFKHFLSVQKHGWEIFNLSLAGGGFFLVFIYPSCATCPWGFRLSMCTLQWLLHPSTLYCTLGILYTCI